MAEKIESGIPTSQCPWGMITETAEGEIRVYRFSNKRLCKSMYIDFASSVGSIYRHVARIKWSAGQQAGDWMGIDAGEYEAEVIEGEYVDG